MHKTISIKVNIQVTFTTNRKGETEISVAWHGFRFQTNELKKS